MTEPAADTSAVLTAQDSLVLASMQTPVEMQLVMDWLGQQRARNPDAEVRRIETALPQCAAVRADGAR